MYIQVCGRNTNFKSDGGTRKFKKGISPVRFTRDIENGV